MVIGAAEIRDEIVRGVILTILIQRNLEWVPVDLLRLQVLRGQGYVLSSDALMFHLAYLSDPARPYVEVRPLRPPRRDAVVRATAKAVDLHDGRIAADPGILF
jgi:hypothetical protein